MKSKQAAVFLLALNLLAGCARAPHADEAATVDGALPEEDSGGFIVLGADEAGAPSANTRQADTGVARGGGGTPDAGSALDAGTGGTPMGAPEAGTAAVTPSGTNNPAMGTDSGTAPELDAGPPAAPPDASSVEPIADAGSAEPVDTGASQAEPPCLPGTYVGVFDGQVQALFGIFTADLTGTITITLALSADGELLKIEDGALSGTDQRGSPIAAKVTGTLNCTTKTFQEIHLTDGTYMGSDPIFGGPPQTITFDGSATGMYFDDPPSAQGRWQVQADSLGLPTGSGTWTARIVN